MDKFEIFGYDVWGNEEDGFEVNDVHSTGRYVKLHEDMDDTDIIDTLKEIDYFGVRYRSDWFTIDGEFDDVLYIILAAKGLPICELRRLPTLQNKAKK